MASGHQKQEVDPRNGNGQYTTTLGKLGRVCTSINLLGPKRAECTKRANLRRLYFPNFTDNVGVEGGDNEHFKLEGEMVFEDNPGLGFSALCVPQVNE